MNTSDAPRVLTYSHDGFGLGHLRRNLRVLSGLTIAQPGVRALAVTGCKCADAFSYPPGVDYLQLPSMTKVAQGVYVPDGRSTTIEQVLRLRKHVITDAMERFKPDLVLVDRYPLGLGRELERALQETRARRRATRFVLGLRDVIDSAPAVRSEWQQDRSEVAIAEFYDAVMIYGSPEVFDPIRAYGLGPAIAAKVHFTGYLMTSYLVDPASHVRQELGLDPHTRLAICTLGGGGDGARVAATFLEAMIVLRDKGWHGVLVTGPYMPEHDRERLQATESVTVVGFVADVPSYLAAADAVLSMGGYNTLCEALSVNAPVVVVPRVEPRLEQLIRAEAFAARGLVRVVHPEELSASRVAEQLLLASGDDAQSRRRSIEALGGSGVENAAAHLSRLLQLSAAAVPQMSGRGGR